MLDCSRSVPEVVRPFKHDRILDFYEECLTDSQGVDPTGSLNILEIGILRGGMILTLLRRLPKARILGLDITPPPDAFWADVDSLDARSRVSIKIGSQADRAFVRSAISETFVGEKLDIVTDDAAHTYRGARPTFEEVFIPYVRPGGFYALEDWGAGYFVDWPDGHPDGRHGLVRLVKELVDEVAIPDRTMEWRGQRSLRVDRDQAPAISRAVITNGLAVFYRGPGDWLAPIGRGPFLDVRILKRDARRLARRAAYRWKRTRRPSP